MSTHEKGNFLQIYDWASDWQQLPWAHHIDKRISGVDDQYTFNPGGNDNENDG